MKKLALVGFVFVFVFLFSVFSVSAYVLSWNQNQEPDLAGYKVRVRHIFEEYADPIDVGLVLNYEFNVGPGIYYAQVLAYDESGNILSDVHASVSGTIGTQTGTPSIGGETTEGETANRFSGNIDEVKVIPNGLCDYYQCK